MYDVESLGEATVALLLSSLSSSLVREETLPLLPSFNDGLLRLRLVGRLNAVVRSSSSSRKPVGDGGFSRGVLLKRGGDLLMDLA